MILRRSAKYRRSGPAIVTSTVCVLCFLSASGAESAPRPVLAGSPANAATPQVSIERRIVKDEKTGRDMGLARVSVVDGVIVDFRVTPLDQVSLEDLLQARAEASSFDQPTTVTLIYSDANIIVYNYTYSNGNYQSVTVSRGSGVVTYGPIQVPEERGER